MEVTKKSMCTEYLQLFDKGDKNFYPMNINYSEYLATPSKFNDSL